MDQPRESLDPGQAGERPRQGGSPNSEVAEASNQQARDGAQNSQNDSPNAGSQPNQSGPQTAQSQNSGASSPSRQGGQPNTTGGQRNAGGLGGFEEFVESAATQFAPIGGEDYLQWSDRLRDVEEMLDESAMRAEVARIRDRARGFRVELKRHSKPPNWDLVRVEVSEPLVEMRNWISEELLKRTSRRAMVPLDRDPVPPKFAEQVRSYYESLGSGKMIVVLGNVILGAPHWQIPAAALLGVGLVCVLWSYAFSGGRRWPRTTAGLLKALGIVLLAACLVDPLFSGVRPRPGANLFSVIVDNSMSLQIRDAGQGQTRGEKMKSQLDTQSSWQTRLEQDFDVRRYCFDARVTSLADFSGLSLEGANSRLFDALADVAQRNSNRAQAGILLLTDGNASYVQPSFDWEKLPPVYPVMIGGSTPAEDIRVHNVSVSQSNFEEAPVTIMAEVDSTQTPTTDVLLRLINEQGEVVQRHDLATDSSGKLIKQRFQLKPTQRGVTFHRVQAVRAEDVEQVDEPEKIREATFRNNSRLVMVDRSGGPYRVLYVTGRPNWEFKFLRRALAADDEVQLVGLVRIAKREPKFKFRGRAGETTNPIYRGFGNQDDEQAEQYDEPVLLRLGTEDKEELRDGFPKSDDQLFRYHAIVLDDLESAFFTQDQLTLIQRFVSKRGGGFLMLGGQESFSNGKYGRTPIAEILPVYLDRPVDKFAGPFQLSLTRDGWLQPWVRTRSTENDERERLSSWSNLQTLNRVRHIKPGATVLAQVEAESGRLPALVVQRFGEGRSAAMMVGDLWRTKMHETEKQPSDLEKSWRQTIRWLVADVPKRIQVRTEADPSAEGARVRLVARVRDKLFDALENCEVTMKVTTPDGRAIDVTGEPSPSQAGEYVADFSSKVPGAYRATASVGWPRWRGSWAAGIWLGGRRVRSRIPNADTQS